MEMDFSLLDLSARDTSERSDVPSEVELDSITDSLPEVESKLVEPKSDPLPSDDKVPQEDTPADDFDDSTPISPREKWLMERLESVQKENLELGKPKSVEAPITIPSSDKDFLEGIDMDDLLSSPANLNNLLHAVRKDALEEASKLTAERILTNLPSIMSQYVTQHLTMTKMAEEFYDNNPDLLSARSTVAAVANKISADHPEFTAEQVFAQSAAEARKILRIKGVVGNGEVATPTNTIKQPKPALAPATKGSRNGAKAPVLSAIERGVLELIS
jgi:hypothetical protein